MASRLRSVKPGRGFFAPPLGHRLPEPRRDEVRNESVPAAPEIVEPAELSSPYPFLFWWFALPLALVIVCELTDLAPLIYSLVFR